MKLRKYHVRGRGRFPIDMLRYDSCWPAGQEDVSLITDSLGGPYELREVALYFNHHAPTDQRWRSFGWVVINQQ